VCEMDFFVTRNEDQERISIVDLVLKLGVISLHERNSRNIFSSHIGVLLYFYLSVALQPLWALAAFSVY
jgi:hypothetical protein